MISLMAKASYLLPLWQTLPTPFLAYSLPMKCSLLLEIIRTRTRKQNYRNRKKNEKSRPWRNTTVGELKAYLGAYVWMGVHKESAIPDYWNSDPDSGPIHTRLKDAIGLKRWQQIERFLHISELYPPCPRPAIFERLEPLSSHLRHVFKLYWLPGTHLTVDETIVRFMGRAKEIVNIPSKPTPEGFKI